MTLTAFLFYLTAALTCLCAVGVVVSRNIVRAAAWLLFALAGTSGLFFLLGADFVGATQLLVYVGGTLVLVVFGVMLTAQGPFVSMRTPATEWAVSTVVGLLLLSVLVVSAANARWGGGEPQKDPFLKSIPVQDPATSRDTAELGKVFTGLPNDSPHRLKEPSLNKQLSEMSYLLPFEIVSVHLLVVLIGAAYLARAKRRRGGAT